MRLGCGVQAVLRHFVDAARGRLDLVTIKMIQRRAAFAGRVALLDGFGDVGFREHGRLHQWAP